MKAANARPGGGDQQIVRAIRVDVAEGDGVETERVAWRSTGICLEQRSILPGIQIRPAAADGRTGVLPCTDDQIRVTVTIDVAGHRRARAEPFARRFSRERQKTTPVFS